MKPIVYLTAFFLSILLSCNSSPNKVKEAKSEVNNQDQPNCIYQYASDSTVVNWKAFKTTEKIGVAGTFETIQIEGIKPSSSPEGVLMGATFSLPIAAINTLLPERDEKIKKFFFGALAEAEAITGKVIAVSSDQVKVAIEMNGITQEVEMKLEVKGRKLSLSSLIDVASWNAMAGIESLNEQCYDLHMGSDGISKLWPEVKIGITSKLTQKCD